MAFFDEVGKKISQTSQGVAQKTKNMAETMKLNGMISDEERSINNAFLQIGKTYYETYGENPEQLFAPLISSINGSKNKIESYSEQIKQIKGVVRCQKCGGEVYNNSPICNSCGSPMETAPAFVPDANGVSCGKCGAMMPSDKLFCTNCGSKIEQAVSEISTESSITIEEVFSSSKPDVIKCPSCGKELSENAMFCSGCGQKMGGNQ